ncbi:MAG: protein kinase [Pirellulaceae bacterium]|nr:MAG: protein kinase [Pirellulaceae bacterium]
MEESLFRTSALVSGLITPEQLDYAMRICRHRLRQQGKEADGRVDDRLLADVLIEQGILTAYQADQLMAGRTKFHLGPYLITEWIGQGGMGRVFKGVHTVMGRECAVKVLPLDRATQEAREAFIREIRMQAKLDCPYLVRAFDAGQEGSVHYLVTEYVPGMDLRRLVKSRGPLPIQQAAKIIMQAALGLDYAHRKGLVHRDVKPGNILVTPQGDAKVSDVGLAGFTHDLMNDPRAGRIVGTTDYLSPEQIRTPLEVQPASDIYSLGCTLYYAVCGKVPFPGGDTESKLRRHLEEYPLHPRTFVPDITEEFVDVIVDMMEKDVRKRIASAAEVAARLEPWANPSLPVGAIPLARSPWSAPPPPSYDPLAWPGPAGDDPAEWTNGTDSTNHRQTTTRSGVCEPTALDLAADGEPGEWSSVNNQAASPFPEPPSARPTRSTAWIVALTIAIVLPPALLAGAIIGYLVSRSF